MRGSELRGADGPGEGRAFTNSIVFVSDRTGAQQVYTMRSDGSHVRQLTTVVGNKDNPVFSPNGRRIAFAMSDTTGPIPQWIYVVNADGSGLTQLTTGFEDDLMPSWSPNGSQIAFVSSRAHNAYRGIFVMNADGGDVHAVVADSVNNDSPSWSPNSNEILFSPGFVGHGVFEITSGGDSIAFRVRGTQPEWSPSGTQFFSIAGSTCVFRVRVMRLWSTRS